MIEVYYYIPADEAENAVECGLKLSKWFDKEVVINGENRKCLSTLLNPRDNIEKFKSGDLKCIKLGLPPHYCFVGDKSLFDIGLNSPEIMETYLKLIVPAESYVFGTYRVPECLVTCTVIPGQLNVMDKRLDSPILYYNSEELYVNTIVEGYKEKYDNFNDTMLYCYYSKIAESGRLIKVEDTGNGMAAFADSDSGKVYTVRIPDMAKCW